MFVFIANKPNMQEDVGVLKGSPVAAELPDASLKSPFVPRGGFGDPHYCFHFHNGDMQCGSEFCRYKAIYRVWTQDCVEHRHFCRNRIDKKWVHKVTNSIKVKLHHIK